MCFFILSHSSFFALCLSHSIICKHDNTHTHAEERKTKCHVKIEIACSSTLSPRPRARVSLSLTHTEPHAGHSAQCPQINCWRSGGLSAWLLFTNTSLKPFCHYLSLFCPSLYLSCCNSATQRDHCCFNLPLFCSQSSFPCFWLFNPFICPALFFGLPLQSLI